jgi:hypothetical protein
MKKLKRTSSCDPSFRRLVPKALAIVTHRFLVLDLDAEQGQLKTTRTTDPIPSRENVRAFAGHDVVRPSASEGFQSGTRRRF